MRDFRSVICLLLGVFLLATPALAEEPSLNFKLQILKSKGSVPKRLYAEADWKQLVESGQLQVIEEISHVAELNIDSLIHVGRKVPIGYKDPRADGYQVQYVDNGVKLDQSTTKLSAGYYQVEVRPERSKLTPSSKNRLDTQNTLIVETTALMKRKQVAVLGTWRGVWVPQYINTTYPQANVTEKDTIFVALTLR